jgi:hypothetical protein
MEVANLILEYIKALLSAPAIFGLAFISFIFCFKSNLKQLIDRIASITLPGGGEISMSQMERVAKAQEATLNPPPDLSASNELSKITLSASDQKIIKEVFEAERARSALWEYRYLNLFLVRATQDVLDWLIALKTPPTIMFANDWWQPMVPDPNERRAIFEALRMHSLIDVQNNQIIVTPKGKEYAQWRGELPRRSAAS